MANANEPFTVLGLTSLTHFVKRNVTDPILNDASMLCEFDRSWRGPSETKVERPKERLGGR